MQLRASARDSGHYGAATAGFRFKGPALTKNIDKLVGHGVVQRGADANDNGRVLVSISDLGLEVVQRLTERVDAHHLGVESMLGIRKPAQLKKLLETFLEADAGND